MTVKHLNQRQLAERWNLSEGTLERWRTMGIGPLYLKFQGRIVYRQSDIDDYEASCLRKSTTNESTHA